MNRADAMRNVMNLMERGVNDQYKGRIDHPSVQYHAEINKGEITKVVANLKAAPSGRYTKLGRNLLEIEALSERLTELKEEVKQDTRELVADLFNAEDVCRTRVVETVSFTFQLSKDPKATETIKYAKVLEELEQHMTPDLIRIMRNLEEKYKTVTQKAPSLKATDHRPAEESIQLGEGLADKLKAFASKFLQAITGWGKRYDQKLDALKAEVGMA